MPRILLGTDLWIEQVASQAFNLDTILLAHFVKIPVKSKRVMDFGTGAGALMLYLSLKTKAQIIGFEIQDERYQQALKNIELNKLGHQLSCFNKDIRALNDKDVDCIVCNPPFFKMTETSNMNENEDLQIARHERMLNLDSLVKAVSKNLKYGGHFFMIHRPDRFAEIVDVFNFYKLSVKRVRFVHPYLHAKANHVLIEAIHNGQPGMNVEPPLILYQEKHVMTNELVNIYGGESNVT